MFDFPRTIWYMSGWWPVGFYVVLIAASIRCMVPLIDQSRTPDVTDGPICMLIGLLASYLLTFPAEEIERNSGIAPPLFLLPLWLSVSVIAAIARGRLTSFRGPMVAFWSGFVSVIIVGIAVVSTILPDVE